MLTTYQQSLAKRVAEAVVHGDADTYHQLMLPEGEARIEMRKMNHRNNMAFCRKVKFHVRELGTAHTQEVRHGAA